MRRLRTFALFILLGAIATTLVAWTFAAIGSAQYSNSPQNHGGWQIASDGKTLAWPVHVPESWPAPTLLVQTRGRGMAFDSGLADSLSAGELRRDASTTFRLISIRAGWPLHAFEHRVMSSVNSGVTKELSRTPAINLPDLVQRFAENHTQGHHARRVLPLKPIWTGFVINTVIFALAFWLVLRSIPFVRTWLRRRRNQCLACGYPIGLGPICTECGGAVKAMVAKQPA